jgi:hypothetical protein
LGFGNFSYIGANGDLLSPVIIDQGGGDSISKDALMLMELPHHDFRVDVNPSGYYSEQSSFKLIGDAIVQHLARQNDR